MATTTIGNILYKWCLNPDETARVALEKIIRKYASEPDVQNVINLFDNIDTDLKSISNNKFELIIASSSTQLISGGDPNKCIATISIKNNLSGETIYFTDLNLPKIVIENREKPNTEADEVITSPEKEDTKSSAEEEQHDDALPKEFICQHAVSVPEDNGTKTICNTTGKCCTALSHQHECPWHTFVQGSIGTSTAVIESTKPPKASGCCYGCQHFSFIHFEKEGSNNYGCCQEPSHNGLLNFYEGCVCKHCKEYHPIDFSMMSSKNVDEIATRYFIEELTDHDMIMHTAFDSDQQLAINFWNAFFDLPLCVLMKYQFRAYDKFTEDLGYKLVPMYICQLLPESYERPACTIDSIPTVLTRYSEYTCLKYETGMTSILIR